MKITLAGGGPEPEEPEPQVARRRITGEQSEYWASSIIRQFDGPISGSASSFMNRSFLILLGFSFGREQKDFLPHRLTLVIIVIRLSIHTSEILLYQSLSTLDSSRPIHESPWSSP
jgi:hypothetical protein